MPANSKVVSNLMIVSAPAMLAVLAGLSTPAGAVPPTGIIWGSAQNIVGDSDVSTSGSLLYAYSVGSADVAGATVNGVTFASYAFPDYAELSNSVSHGSASFVESLGVLWSSDSLGANPLLSSDYQLLLGSGGGASEIPTITATLGGLTAGRRYLVQVWSNNGGDEFSPSGFSIASTVLDALGSSVTLDANVEGEPDGLGQFVLGEFIATGTSQTFTLDGSGGNPLINAFQVRDITPIPGPGGAAVAAALGTLRPGGRRRRR